MREILALFNARNKEFFRDRGSLVWALVMPPIIIGIMALAFSGGEQTLFKIGFVSIPSEQLPAALQTDYIQALEYESIDVAMNRIRHHQLDMLIGPATTDNSQRLSYWINDASASGQVLETLLAHDKSESLQRQTVSGRPVRYIDWVIPGILGMNILFSGLFGIGYVIVRYRKNGVLKRLQATPVKPWQFLSAQIASRLLITLLMSVFVYVSADLFLDFLMLGSYWHLLLVSLLGIAAILALALVIAARFSSEEFVNGLLNMVSFPMLLLSELWFSLDGSPAWLSGFSQALPLTHVVGAARAIMIEGAGLADISQHLWYLVVITLVSMAIAAKLFRWN
jgi:ABC-type multidrug transport system permease subunit